MCPLTAAPEGVPLRVSVLAGGGCFRRRLADLGVVPGASIVLVRRGAPVLLALGGSRFGLGFSMAEKILVELDDCHRSAPAEALEGPQKRRSA